LINSAKLIHFIKNLNMDGQARINILLEVRDRARAGMAAARNHINRNVAEIRSNIASLRGGTVNAFRSMVSSVPGLGTAIGMLKNPITIVVAAVTMLIGVYSKASAMAAQFDSAMRKANVTAQETGEGYRKMSADILEAAASSNMAGATQQAPEAFNKLISSGLTKDASLEALNPTLEAAKAGYTDVATVAKAAAATMSSSGANVTRTYDVLFATLNKGNAEFADIANYLPKIIPGAKDAGFELEQVAGAYAFLTAQGMNAEASSTGLMNVFKALKDNDIINGSKSKMGLKRLGIDVFDAQGKTKALVDVMEQLRGKMDGLNNDQKVKFLDQIGFDQEAGTAIASFTQNMDKLRDTVNFTTNSAGQLKAAIEAAGSPMDSWDQIGNRIDATFIQVGTTVNESLGSIGTWLAPIVDNVLPKLGSIFSGIWEVVSSIAEVIFAIPKAIIEWANKSELVSDIFSLIGTILTGLKDAIVWVADKISWLFDHTIKPILDAVEWLYGKIKGLFTEGAKESKAAAVEQYNAMSPDERDKMRYDDPKRFAEINQWVEDGKSQEQKDGEAAMLANDRKVWEEAMLADDAKRAAAKNLLATNRFNNTMKTGDKGGGKKKTDEKGVGISGGQQTRIININKVAMIEGDFISNHQDFANMSKSDIEKWLEQMFARFNANMAKSYSQ
jgi:TP901 family phage tail tape measure protein